MRLENPLDELLGSRVKLRIARTIATEPRQEHTGRELALITKVSQPQANKALKVLESYGVVESRVVGKSIVWKRNGRSHVYRKLLLPLFRNEKMVLGDLKKYLARILGPISKKVILFGSIARGEGKEASDLDLCIVTSNKGQVKKALSELQPEITRNYNIVISPIIYSPREYRASKIIKGGEMICERE